MVEWQTRTLEGRMSNREGSSPSDRTIKTRQNGVLDFRLFSRETPAPLGGAKVVGI